MLCVVRKSGDQDEVDEGSDNSKQRDGADIPEKLFSLQGNACWKDDWWDEISDKEKAAIEAGIAQADRGELIPHEQVMKKLRAKYKL